MDAAGIHQRLSAALETAETGEASRCELVTDNPDPYFIIAAADVTRACRFLRDDPAIACDFLESISGVDTGEHLWLVYHLFSYEHRHGVVLKIKTDYETLDVPSCCEIWPAANWHEREQYDLFGFNFLNHPDLRRILLPEDWVGHPLLKSYVYPEEYHGIDHYRPDPMMQLKASDQKKAEKKAKAEAKKTQAPAASES